MSVAKRIVRAFSVGSVCVASTVAVSVPASADLPDTQELGSCVFTLTKPSVVEISGVKMVTATLTSLPCTGDILPNDQTVCVELQGNGSAPQCRNVGGYEAAQVYYAPYVPGATYVSTGTGCGNGGVLLQTSCTTQGPLTATL